MAYRIFWTPIAVQDLRDICDFISRDNLVAAQRMGEELIKESEAMAAFPMSGRIVPVVCAVAIVRWSATCRAWPNRCREKPLVSEVFTFFSCSVGRQYALGCAPETCVPIMELARSKGE
jgi:ParE toxin of type II toxin-antitoxin system, parDE